MPWSLNVEVEGNRGERGRWSGGARVVELKAWTRRLGCGWGRPKQYPMRAFGAGQACLIHCWTGSICFVKQLYK